MGGYVYILKSDIDFEWKRWFIKQPDRFGKVLELALPGYTTRYRGDGGEVVRLAGKRADIVRDLRLFLKTQRLMSALKTEHLPNCNIEMLHKLLLTLWTDEDVDNKVEVWFFVEY